MHRIVRMLGVTTLITGLAVSAVAQTTEPPADPAVGTEQHTVTARPLDEETLVGPNRQPDWTTQHRFSEVEIYLLAPWELSAEAGWDASVAEEGEVSHAVRQEFEIGLPWHTQIDYVIREAASEDESFDIVGHSIEGSVALAEWGVIPLNPTVLFEYTFGVGEPDEWEAKLLVGDELAPRWHWGANFAYEQQTGGERETEIGGSAAVSYSVLDRKLGLGVETKITAEEEEEVDADGEVEEEEEILATLGPSAQWRITDDIHLNLAALFGLTEASPTVDTYVALAFTWGADDDESGGASRPSEEDRLEPMSNRHQ